MMEDLTFFEEVSYEEEMASTILNNAKTRSVAKDVFLAEHYNLQGEPCEEPGFFLLEYEVSFGWCHITVSWSPVPNCHEFLTYDRMLP